MTEEENKYYDAKFPQSEWHDGIRSFCWQCAYADRTDTPEVLKISVWLRLSNYDRLDRCYNRKYYDSADSALEDLDKALKNN